MYDNKNVYGKPLSDVTVISNSIYNCFAMYEVAITLPNEVKESI